MAVTRLERKAARNKSRAKLRVKTIKRFKTRNYTASPYKDESGIVLEGDASTVAAAIQNAPVAKAKKEDSKAPVAAEETVAPKAPKAKTDKADKLNKIEGIGPKIAEVLAAGGLDTFAAVAASTPEAIREILDNAEGNFKAHDPATWPMQAQMAADGDWDALKTWQDEHIGGKAKA